MFSCPPSLDTLTKEFLEKRNSLKHRQFFSLDETSFGRNGFQSRGYALKGTKLFVKKKLPRMTSISVCACASSSKWIGYLDNIKFHHSKEVINYLKSIDVVPLFTPPYSPWFNPIEGCFSIVKRSFSDHQDVDLAFHYLKPHHFEAFFKKSLESTTRW